MQFQRHRLSRSQRLHLLVRHPSAATLLHSHASPTRPVRSQHPEVPTIPVSTHPALCTSPPQPLSAVKLQHKQRPLNIDVECILSTEAAQAAAAEISVHPTTSLPSPHHRGECASEGWWTLLDVLNGTDAHTWKRCEEKKGLARRQDSVPLHCSSSLYMCFSTKAHPHTGADARHSGVTTREIRALTALHASGRHPHTAYSEYVKHVYVWRGRSKARSTLLIAMT